MTAGRVVWMSEAQRDAILSGHRGACIAHAHDLARAYDETGEQPRVRWCSTHASQITNGDSCDKGRAFSYHAPFCRVVSAIVVVPPGDAEP